MSAFGGLGLVRGGAALWRTGTDRRRTSAPSIARLATYALASGAALLLHAVSPTFRLFADLTMIPLGFAVMVFIITANSMLQLRSLPKASSADG